MQISVINPVLQTVLFTALLFYIIVVTSKKDPNKHEMNKTHTNELKGIAILMVIFCHAGYFLAKDTRFLFPLSADGGVGVNLFLFLSGFGLTMSALQTNLPPIEFYKKRLGNIFVPMWITLGLFLLMDHFILGSNYPLSLIIKNFLGFFPEADIFSSLNSPLWYFTFILFYYLTFPIVFKKDSPVISSLALLLLGFLFFKLNVPVNKDVLRLYTLHFITFPVGMLAAYVLFKRPGAVLRNNFVDMFSSASMPRIIKYILILVFIGLFAYTSYYSNVGTTVIKEQLTSIFTALCLFIIVLLKSYKSSFLEFLGKYSYEVYLIQWPIMYKYDILYKFLPAFLATFLYLVLIILLAIGLRKITSLLSNISEKFMKK